VLVKEPPPTQEQHAFNERHTARHQANPRH
jgi:hypothetical protein